MFNLSSLFQHTLLWLKRMFFFKIFLWASDNAPKARKVTRFLSNQREKKNYCKAKKESKFFPIKSKLKVRD